MRRRVRPAPPLEFRCAVKTRYRQADLPCLVRSGRDAAHAANDDVRVELDAPARAVTPGQYAVFYDGDVCMGGGVIARRHKNGSGTIRAPAPEPQIFGERQGSMPYNSFFSAEGS